MERSEIKSGVWFSIYKVECYFYTSSTLSYSFIYTDHIGSVDKITDKDGNVVDSMSFDAWGNRRNRLNFSKREENITHLIDRGFTMHQHLDVFNLINMGGRVYDPDVQQFLSPDPYVQMPDNTQNLNRYAYCMNSPTMYVDPSGEIAWFVPVIIGAVIGAYTGGTIANQGEMNPIKWNYNSGKTWGYMFGGAAIGGLSGYVGWAIAGSGIPFANTLSMVGSSFVNSLGTSVYTGGQVTPSVSFGVASYDLGTGEWGYLGKKGNKWYENLGYSLGALANVSDILAGFNPQSVDLVTEHSDNVGHSALVKEGTTTGVAGSPDPNALISVGPDYNVQDAKQTWHWTRGTNGWDSHSRAGEVIWRQNLKVNMSTIERYSNWLNSVCPETPFFEQLVKNNNIKKGDHCLHVTRKAKCGE
ncbi:MAG: hypothetical protein LBG80_01705 [Bacteroidales bacterium]|jgi:RHS repeat-associated protein|nr:hypothetical protein [Bacteroidales bacterium]